MLIRNVTREQLNQALAKTNEEFGGNVRFRDIRTANTKQTHWRVTLRVNNSKELGAKLSIIYQLDGHRFTRHTVSACWHVHGTFMDSLPQGCSIVTQGRTKHPGDVWEDWNIGSQMFPVYHSESCECGG